MNITHAGIGNLYRYLLIEQNDGVAVAQMNDYIAEVCLLNQERTEEGQRNRFPKIVGLIHSLAATLRKLDYSKIPTGKISLETQNLQSEGAYLFHQIRGINPKEKMSCLSVIHKTIAIAKNHFTPETAISFLRKQAIQQHTAIQLDIEKQRLFRGLIGFYEIVMKRPDLQYVQSGARYQFLMIFPRFLAEMIQSFSENMDSKGIHHVEVLSQSVKKHKDSLKALCFQSPETEFFINELSALEKENIPTFYSRLKQIARGNCPEGKSPKELIQEKAEAISASIPAQLKGDSLDAAQKRASAFGLLRGHGGGVRVTGFDTGAGANFHSDFFGQGIKDGKSSVPISIYREESLALLDNEKTKQALRDHGKKVVENYYKNHRIENCSHEVIEANGSAIERQIRDEFANVLLTLNDLLEYELAEYKRKNGYWLPLNVQTENGLKPQMLKKIILFGLKNDIFSVGVLQQLYFQFSIHSEPMLSHHYYASMQRQIRKERQGDDQKLDFDQGESFDSLSELKGILFGPSLEENEDEALESMRIFDQLTADPEGENPEPQQKSPRAKNG